MGMGLSNIKVYIYPGYVFLTRLWSWGSSPSQIMMPSAWLAFASKVSNLRDWNHIVEAIEEKRQKAKTDGLPTRRE